MKLMAALALACGLPPRRWAAGTASARRERATASTVCHTWIATSFLPTLASSPPGIPFGLDATGKTFVCVAKNKWVPVAPLIGVRTMRAPCDEKVPGTAQTPLGQLMDCEGQAWTAYNDVLYYD